jgi:hypothetical protein
MSPRLLFRSPKKDGVRLGLGLVHIVLYGLSLAVREIIRFRDLCDTFFRTFVSRSKNVHFATNFEFSYCS